MCIWLVAYGCCLFVGLRTNTRLLSHTHTHTYIQRCPEEEIVCNAPFRFEPDMSAEGRPSAAELTAEEVKNMILDEIRVYHPDLAVRPTAT